MVEIEGQPLHVAVKRGQSTRPPLLLFNGIGANWQLAVPFLSALTCTEAIVFDIPGVGGSPLPKGPYRPSTMARLGSKLVRHFGYEQVDVAGVSWGGCLAQEFAHRHPSLCRKLVLAATSPGVTMMPGKLSALVKMSTPRRYLDNGYMQRVAGDIYGGAFRTDPTLTAQHTEAMTGGGRLSYLYQLLALAGWTSLPWLWTLKQPTLVLMGRDDPIVRVINGRILARLVPNSRLRLVDDGHLFLITRPAESALIIERFLAEDDGA